MPQRHRAARGRDDQLACAAHHAEGGALILEFGGLTLLVVVAVALLRPLLAAERRQRARNQWPVVTAFVTAHRLRQERGAWFPEHQVRLQIQHHDTQVWCGSPEGVGITGHGPRANPEAAARRVLERAPVGTAIQVRVNLADGPSALRVERELPLTTVAAAATATVVGLIGVAVWILVGSMG